MNSRNKLAEMPIRPLLYTMAVPLMLSLLVQSLYNIVDSIFVARLSETALTAASLVYSIQLSTLRYLLVRFSSACSNGSIPSSV